ncbi:hypothetical protein C1H76_2746 [Elsinoe australis]|uniref:Uncharacterized protein n=1 Tax=Elsinoe australis TaxID=40998 RepID=A0A4U7B2E5_9PEZI|nr:hypothetical protein C1H76_2746 [Elsinoe australis]
MFSPTAAHHTFTPLSPNPNLHSPSLGGMQSPSLSSSPYRLPALPRPSSGDLVSGIVDKFNSLSVTDREEEKARYERQIAKLKAALDRACMAREEAETEAGNSREKLLEIQEERVRERDVLRERCREYEKKYEKAKDRFKLQRSKNEEAMQAVKSEFLEKEKDHWRNVAVAQEAEEWERTLRIQANELIEFVELERTFEIETIKRRRTSEETKEEVRSVSEGTADVAVEEETEDATMEDTTVVPEPRQQHPRDEEPVESRPVSRGSETAEPEQEEDDDHLHVQRSSESLREVTPEGPPSMSIRPFHTPAKQVTRVPVDFGDVEDKENRAPAVAAAVLKTPMTMDRAAALAAIEYRRGRARSFMNAQMTPKTLALVDKRDVSAPAMVTMTVGRKR